MPNEVSFPAEGIERLSNIEAWHFWFVGRRLLTEKLLQSYLPARNARLLDIGCGTGYMVQHLSEKGYDVTGIDHHMSPNRQTARLLQGNARALPFQRDSVDAVLMLDILEHTDDQQVLAEARRVLRPNGLVFISVPAFPWLWSYRDDAAGHLRRYTKKTLTDALEANGYTLLELEFYQFSAMPLLLLSRWFGRYGPTTRDLEDRPHSFINRVMTLINTTEVWLRSYLRWPWGSTLIAVGRRDS